MRKEKPKFDTTKFRSDRRLSMKDCSPRPLVLDFGDTTNRINSREVSSKQIDLTSPRIPTKIHRKSVQNSISRTFDLCLRRKHSSSCIDADKDKEAIEVETSDASIVEAVDIKCVGNKYASDQILSASTAHRKLSMCSLRPSNARGRLKPLNAMSATNLKLNNQNGRKLEKSTAPPPRPTHIKEYRKYLVQKIPSAHKSNLFTDGLSLRAWQSKYNRLATKNAVKPI